MGSLQFINEALRHCKPIGAVAEGIKLPKQFSIRRLEYSVDNVKSQHGLVTLGSSTGFNTFIKAFSQAIAQHRYWGGKKRQWCRLNTPVEEHIQVNKLYSTEYRIRNIRKFTLLAFFLH